jgi:hypothetical protein
MARRVKEKKDKDHKDKKKKDRDQNDQKSKEDKAREKEKEKDKDKDQRLKETSIVTRSVGNKKLNDENVLKTRIQKSIFKPKHTLVSHGRVYNVCKTCPSYMRKRLRVLK